jgi:DNA replication and repair protein RecF
MLLESIYLYNFRNYIKQDFNFNKDNNVIVALNGIGKSNLIEAIYIFSIARSFRTSVNKDLINFGKNDASIISNIINNNKKNKIKVIFKKDENKKVFINDNIVKKTSELIKEFTAILISPNDVSIIEYSPSVRRKYLDMIISKIIDNYIQESNELKKIIENKRKILKEEKINEDLLSVYQIKLEEINVEIINKRKKILIDLENIVNDNIQKFYKQIEKVSFKYINSFDNFDIKKEKKYRECLFGAHRDDFEIYLGNINSKKFNSTGEKRLISLLLKIAEKEIFNKKLSIKPVILLDDAFLGLDDERKDIFFKILENDHQKIITTTNEKDLYFLNNINIIKL